MEKNIDFGQDQNVGLSGREIQEDVVRVAPLTTSGGLSLLVGAVVDGESSSGNGTAVAKRVMAAFRRTLKDAPGADINKAIRRAFEDAQGAIELQVAAPETGLPDHASATLAIIYKKRLYLGHSGNTRAYLVRGDGVYALTRDHVDKQGRLLQAIGLGETLRVDVGIPANSELDPASDGSLALQDGDHLVLCSDGLVAEQPGGRGPYLDAAREMPRVLNDRQTPALETARTLVSLAVGRKAQDNVSVVVVSIPRRRRPIGLIVGVVAIICLALAIGGGIAGARILTPAPTATQAPTAMPTPAPSGTPIPQDLGKATIGLVQGPVSIDGLAAGRGGDVPAGRDRGLIQTAAEGRVELLLTDGALLYLGSDTQLNLLQVDVTGDPTTTRLALLTGQILLHQDGQGDRIEIVDGDDNVLGILAKNGTMSVAVESGQVTVSCFAGNCEIAGFALRAGEEVDITAGGEAGGTKAISLARSEQWQAQCGCLNSP